MNGPIKKTIAREFCFKFLYQLSLKENAKLKEELIDGGTEDGLIDNQLESFSSSFQEPDNEHPDNTLTDKTKFLARMLIVGTLQNWETINSQVSECLKSGWSMEKLDKVDQCILMTSAYELSYSEDTPVQIVINESIEMAKKFSSKESASFINAVLDNYAKKFR